VRLGWSSVRAAARTLLQRNCVRQTENVHAVSSGYICRYFLLIVLDQSSIILKESPIIQIYYNVIVSEVEK